MLTGSMPKRWDKVKGGGRGRCYHERVLSSYSWRYDTWRPAGWSDKKARKCCSSLKKNLAWLHTLTKSGTQLYVSVSAPHRIFPLSTFELDSLKSNPWKNLHPLAEYRINPFYYFEHIFLSFFFFSLSFSLLFKTKYYIYRDKKIMWQAWHDTVTRNNLYRYTLHEFN